jgi:hypothetical protein
MIWNLYRNKRNDRLFSHEILSGENNLPLLYLLPKFQKTYKGSNLSPTPDTPVEDITNSLEDLGFNVINVRQNDVHSKSTQSTKPCGSSLFLVTLTRSIKSQEIFKLNSFNHIIIKVQLYRAQTGLEQCYNCQNFGRLGQLQGTPLKSVVQWWPPA